MKKSSLPISSLSLLLAQSMNASIINVISEKTFIPMSGVHNFDWDVDGNGTTDFILHAYTTLFDFLVGSWVSFKPANLGTAPNNGILMNTTERFHNVVQFADGVEIGSASIQTTLNKNVTAKWLTPLPSNFYWQVMTKMPDIDGGHTFNQIYNYGASTRYISAGKVASAKIGFRFEDADDNLHYGWASIQLTGAVVGVDPAMLTILEWSYNSIANEPIQVGAVPEAKHFAAGLAMLAFGAAGLRRWRKHKG